MSYTPFARWRNFTLENLKTMLDLYPDLLTTMRREDVADQLDKAFPGYKRTAYQFGCQLGIESRSKFFTKQNYLYFLDDIGLEKYLNFWFKMYVCPNPYIQSSDQACSPFVEIAERVIASPEHTISYSKFCDEVFGEGKSIDIFKNALSLYGKPLTVNDDDISVASKDIEKLQEYVNKVKSTLPMNDNKSPDEFFNRFTCEKFLKFYDMTTIDTFSNDKATNPLSNQAHSTLKTGDNIIIYGVPGCGKSHKIKKEYCNDEAFMERVVFHPDYTYSDFVGQILPQNIDGHISYPFVLGPFTRILKKSVTDEDNNYYLIIEELNRGNAPAIFGEVFQLLDRIDGVSEYGINNADIALSVYGDATHQVKIPKNLFILATMNTADQNVFTLDTAFKRRWRMRSITNDVSQCFFAGKPICSTEISWKTFLKTINEMIVDLSEGNIGSEDKRLGAFFLQASELDNIDMFSEKVLMYLWNDALKFNHDKIFKSEYKTLDQLISAFKSLKFDVFTIPFEKTTNNSDLLETTGEELPVTPEQYLEGKTDVAKSLYNQLLEKFKETGKVYTISAVANYISLKSPSGQIAVEIHLQKSNVKLLIKEPLNEDYKIGRLLPDTYKWTKNYEIIFDESKDVESVIGAIVDSYEQVNG